MKRLYRIFLFVYLISTAPYFSLFAETEMNNDVWSLTFPNGKTKALILSYDDGLEQDVRLIEILNKYGIKGTFNLNSGFLGGTADWLEGVVGDKGTYLSSDQLNEIYAGHEIAGHSVHHPRLPDLNKSKIRDEISEDQKTLSEITGDSISSFAYPFGTYDDKTIEVLDELNFLSARTVENTGNFNLPKNSLKWDPTCHHTNAIEYIEIFLETDQPLATLSIWGHSWEFDKNEPNNNWKFFENLMHQLSGKEDIWYTTASEYFRFLEEMKKSSVLEWIRKQHLQTKITASVCTGVFILAAANVVINQSVTTHWEDISDLQQLFPKLEVVENRNWVQDDKIITSGGISSGIDMSLQLVSQLTNSELATKTARQMEYRWQQ